MRFNKINYSVFLILTSLFFSCNKQSPYLNGSVEMVSIPQSTDTLVGSTVELNGEYTGLSSVFDDSIIFISYKYTDYVIKVYNANTGAMLGELCRKGNGPDEVNTLLSRNQHYRDEWGLNLWTVVNQNTVKLLRISESLGSKKTVFDTLQFHLDNKKRFPVPYLYFFKHTEGFYLVKNQAVDKFEKGVDYEPGAYHLYDSQTNKCVKTFTLFKKPLLNEGNAKLGVVKEAYFASKDAIKPDGSKIAMAMLQMGQLNIMDTQTGEIKGYRVKGTPDFDYLEGPYDTMTAFYQDISVCDDYIYVSYCNQLAGDGRRRLTSQYVHIFTWDGDFVRCLYLDEPFLRMTVDPITHKLYTYDTYDRVVRYDLAPLL